LNTFIETCEKVCGKKANIIQKSIQPGDVPHTYACIDKAKHDLDYNPQIVLESGLRKSLFQW
jgi:nucleoside-diphosphate-sugar epimerase